MAASKYPRADWRRIGDDLLRHFALYAAVAAALALLIKLRS